jgi:hypothetical protein
MDDELRTTRPVVPDRIVRRLAALVFAAVALLALYALIQRLG